jgi:translation initiation factor IF-1
MAAEDAIRVEGRVIEVLSPRLVRVELANGHRLLGHGTRRNAGRMAGLEPGRNVWVKLSPADMSVGRIQFNEERETK